ncbi:putative Phytocyanin domain, cupredoxin [Dioscorea sansibarensis]
MFIDFIGSVSVFVYPPDQDSVLLVDEAAYKTCNTSSYIDKFDDGNTVFTFTRSGEFYFISGNHENCLKNESLIVVVMASRSNGTVATAPSPPPSPSSLAPPPPPETVVLTPASSPAVQPTSPPSPSGVSSSKVASFMSSLGALLGVFISFVL